LGIGDAEFFYRPNALPVAKSLRGNPEGIDSENSTEIRPPLFELFC